MSDLPGKPDFAIKKFKIAIFVDGEFWHGYNWNLNKVKIKNNREYWEKKIGGNIIRDRTVTLELENMGFKVFRFWAQDVIKRPHALALEVKGFIESKRNSN